jgi:16S rRNA (guanine966-N2)-methyltransferase
VSRIIAGTHRGRRLQVPPGSGTRPTSDRAREGLFSSLQTLLDLDGVRVLDLYAGSGALGLEALSRGAATATLVERDPLALRVLRHNLVETGLPATVVDGDVGRHLKGAVTPYDLVLMDPPYNEDPDLETVVPWLLPGGVLVLERAARAADPAVPEGLEALRSRRYGEAALWYFRRS